MQQERNRRVRSTDWLERMSYENTNCPCGEKKPTDTMLCDACNAHFADRREMADYQNGGLKVEWRRGAAIILLALARRRKKDIERVKKDVYAGQPLTSGLGIATL
jgi:hypothetical protein